LLPSAHRGPMDQRSGTSQDARKKIRSISWLDSQFRQAEKKRAVYLRARLIYLMSQATGGGVTEAVNQPGFLGALSFMTVQCRKLQIARMTIHESVTTSWQHTRRP